MAALILVGVAFSSLASASDPVRRTNQKASASGVHCVVWGDGPYFGMKFHNENDADQQFKQAKRDELVAIHYDNRFREVQRFKSPRMKAVTWHRLADWCKEEHEAEASSGMLPKLEIGVGATGTVTEELMEQSKQSSLIDTGSGREVPLKGADPQSDSPAMAVRASSNLVGKVGMIEEELTQLASQAVGTFDSIGVKNYVSALSLGGKDSSKLKTRVAVLENFLAGMGDNIKSLEEEVLGASAVTIPATSPIEKMALKAKVDSMVGKVDNLKKRMVGIDTSVITQLPKLEERVASYSSKVASMFKNLGFPDAAAQAFTANKGDTFQARIVSVEGAIVQAQRSTKTLGYELLEHSWDSPRELPKVKGIKPQLESLKTLVDDLHHRVSELEAAPLKDDIDKAEKSLKLVQVKSAELSKRIGSEAPSSVFESQAVRDTSLKDRITRLESVASMVESRYGELEKELLGGEKVSSQSLAHTQSVKDRTKALGVKVDGLAKRAAALEQEV